MTTPFTLDCDTTGISRLTVAGHEVPLDQVTAVVLDATPGQPVCLTIVQRAEGTITGIADIDIVGREGSAVAEWLEQLDPGELERQALQGASASTSPTAALLAVLASWARGDES